VLTGRSAAKTTWVHLDEFLKEHGEERSRRLRAVA
jgi:hypothetical protein